MSVDRNDTTDPPTYDFYCPEPFGCGGDDGPFRSVGWSRKKDAVARGRQHAAEHQGGAEAAEYANNARAELLEERQRKEQPILREDFTAIEAQADEIAAAAVMPELIDFENQGA